MIFICLLKPILTHCSPSVTLQSNHCMNSEEFQVVYGIEPELETLEKVYKEIETKFRTVKKQLEVISDKIIENGISEDETVVKAHEKSWCRS